MAVEKTMDKIVALCKNRGYVFPGSEIYGGLANTWDYGPLGVEFKNNVKKAWWRKFIQENKHKRIRKRISGKIQLMKLKRRAGCAHCCQFQINAGLRNLARV